MRTLFLILAAVSFANLLEIEKSALSVALKQFIRFLIRTNYKEKDGFCLIMINKIHSDYLDYTAKLMTINNSMYIINFDIDKNSTPQINPRHFKIAFVDPEGELAHAQQTFKKVRVSRARVVLILTKEPLPLFMRYLLNSYKQINALDTILVYENSYGSIEVIAFNPYQKSDFLVNLTSTKYTQDLFWDKTQNLHGKSLTALLTYPDRTKVTRNPKTLHYDGKDVVTLRTIIENLNGKLVISNMDNILFNPWYESLEFPNREQTKKRIMSLRNVELFLKSEVFGIDNDIEDNLYPHTQNDLVALVPKSLAESFTKKLMSLFTWYEFCLNSFINVGFLLGLIAIKLMKKGQIGFVSLIFSMFKILCTNSWAVVPRGKFERILVLAFVIYSFLIDLFLITKITSFLTVTTFEPEIDSIDEMLRANLQLYAIPKHIEELKKKYSGTRYEGFINTFVPLGTNEGLIDQLFFIKQENYFPFLIDKDIAVFVSRFKQFRANGAPIYHLMKESLIPNYQAYKVPHSSPLLRIFNKKLRMLEEGGFIGLWARRAIENATILGNLTVENYDENVGVTKAVSLGVLQVAFFIVLAGESLGLIVFFLELLIGRLGKK